MSIPPSCPKDAKLRDAPLPGGMWWVGKLGKGPAEARDGRPRCGSLGSWQPYEVDAVAKQMALVLPTAILRAGSPSMVWRSHRGAQPKWLWLPLGCSLTLSELLCESEDFLACSTMVQYQRKMRKPGREEGWVNFLKGPRTAKSEASLPGMASQTPSSPHQ